MQTGERIGMTNRILVSGIAMLALTPAFAFAGRKYGTAGCGLGSAVMGKNGSQVSAATTNGTFWSKYLGITFATSNCVQDRTDTAQLEQEFFMMENYNLLSKEIAQGNGSSLDGLAQLLGCEQDKLTSFKVFAQHEHQKVFAAPGAVAALETLKDSMRSNSELAKSCKYVAAADGSEVSQ